MQTLYADVLFFINFSMDFLALWLTGGILHRKRTARLFLGAGIGAGYAVMTVLFPGSPVFSAVIFFAAALLIVYASYPVASVRQFFLSTVLFLTVSVLLGGVVTVLYTAAGNLLFDGNTLPRRADLLLTLAGIASVMVSLAERFFRRSAVGRLYEIELTVYPGRTVRLTALADSGNLLCDSISGKPVILLSRTAAGLAFPPEYLTLKDGIPPPEAKMHPVFADVAGGHKMLFAVLPHDVRRCGKKNKKIPLAAAVAIDTERKDFDGSDALLPVSLLYG